jgi:hypothetical protein
VIATLHDRQLGAASAAHMEIPKMTETPMTEQQTTQLMEQYGITTEQLSVYHYAGFRYSNLSDALNYAELMASREKEPRAVDERPAR